MRQPRDALRNESGKATKTSFDLHDVNNIVEGQKLSKIVIVFLTVPVGIICYAYDYHWPLSFIAYECPMHVSHGTHACDLAAPLQNKCVTREVNQVYCSVAATIAMQNMSIHECKNGIVIDKQIQNQNAQTLYAKHKTNIVIVQCYTCTLRLYT